MRDQPNAFRPNGAKELPELNHSVENCPAVSCPNLVSQPIESFGSSKLLRAHMHHDVLECLMMARRLVLETCEVLHRVTPVRVDRPKECALDLGRRHRTQPDRVKVFLDKAVLWPQLTN